MSFVKIFNDNHIKNNLDIEILIIVKKNLKDISNNEKIFNLSDEEKALLFALLLREYVDTEIINNDKIKSDMKEFILSDSKQK